MLVFGFFCLVGSRLSEMMLAGCWDGRTLESVDLEAERESNRLRFADGDEMQT